MAFGRRLSRAATTVLSGFLLGISGWAWAHGQEWVAVFLIAFGVAFPAAWLIARRYGRRPVVGLPSVAVQPALLAVLSFILGICELAGIGLRRDVGRGVLALLGAGAFAYGTFLIARAFRPRD